MYNNLIHESGSLIKWRRWCPMMLLFLIIIVLFLSYSVINFISQSNNCYLLLSSHLTLTFNNNHCNILLNKSPINLIFVNRPLERQFPFPLFLCVAIVQWHPLSQRHLPFLHFRKNISKRAESNQFL